MNPGLFYTEEKTRFQNPDLEKSTVWKWADRIYIPAPKDIQEDSAALILWWTEPQRFSDLWVIACDRPFERRWAESWSAYAQSQERGFMHISLRSGWNSLFIVMKDRPQSRILIRTAWSIDREIWPPES